jgi:hypothetical protein
MNALQFFDWGAIFKEKRLSYKTVLTGAYTNGVTHRDFGSFQGLAFTVRLDIIHKDNEIIFKFKTNTGEVEGINKLIAYTPNKLILGFSADDVDTYNKYVQNFLNQEFDIYVNGERCSNVSKQKSTEVIISFSGSKTVSANEILEVKIVFKD